MTPLKKIIFWTIFVLLIPLAIVSYADTLKTKYTIIHGSQQDIKKLNSKIKYDPDKPFWCLFDDSMNLGRKIDAICERVRDILGMKKKFPRIRINLYPNKKQLKAAYIETHGACSYQESRAWYTFETNTICLNMEDLKEKMLAHEMAHAVVDHYLSVRPPRETAEILAKTVEKNLYYDRF